MEPAVEEGEEKGKRMEMGGEVKAGERQEKELGSPCHPLKPSQLMPAVQNLQYLYQNSRNPLQPRKTLC